MPRILEVIQRLMPQGTVPMARRTWTTAPPWPPDMFAVVGSLVSMSGCYSRTAYTDHSSDICHFTPMHRGDVVKIGDAWSRGDLPEEVQRHWRRLLADGDQDVAQPDATWCNAAMTLMMIADEASIGIGFVDPTRPTPIPDYVADQHWRRFLRKRKTRLREEDLPHLPYSLCWRVAPAEVCVQPKVRTPQVGCTLRSVSHNLALLPPRGELETSWFYAARGRPSSEEPMSLILVPFPYRIDGTAFGEDASEGPSKFFAMRQTWLRPSGRQLSSTRIASYLVDLVQSGRHEVRRVHGLVLPELALHASQIREVASILARRTDLELFITGVLDDEHSKGGLPRNEVYSAIFNDHRVMTWWTQTKHHRWRLDGDQIRRYQLGDALDPRYLWWEKIELGQRRASFYVFKHGASLATLVCEDLARIDPVQAALRAVGPNLVIVLLMDGPQFEKRWPGKYATVLADDPGSSVLTLTSFGMVRRSNLPGETECREIALWKESPSSPAKELKLPSGAHALLVTLSQSWETNFTLDGRNDDNGTMKLSLSGVSGLRHPNPPGWLGL